MRRQRGLTMIDLSISLVLVGAVSIVAGGLALDAQRNSELGAAYAQDITETRRALDAVERDLRAGSGAAWTLDGKSLRRDGVVVARNVAAFDVKRDGACFVVAIELGRRSSMAKKTARIETVVRPRVESAR